MAMFVSSCATNGAVTGTGKSDSDTLVLARVSEKSPGFVQPLAPSRSAMPSSSLPKLGRDKHKMPFYHPSQRTRVVRTTAYTHSERDHLAYGPRNAVGTSLKYTSSVRSAAAFLVFTLLYTPCVAAIASIKRELGSKWAISVVILQCAIAWIAAFLIYLIGSWM